MENEIKKEIDDFPSIHDDENDTDYSLSPPLAKKIMHSKPRRLTKKPKAGANWTDEDVFKLIACVEMRPALWNAGDAKYKNRVERTRLWNEISEYEFNCKFDGSQLLGKWSNIRIQYRSYANKKTKIGQVSEAPVNWKFFSTLEFVGRIDVESTSRTNSNFVSQPLN